MAARSKIPNTLASPTRRLTVTNVNKGRQRFLDITPQLMRIKRRANERKCVSIKDTHFRSLPQNAKIGFKAHPEAQSH